MPAQPPPEPPARKGRRSHVQVRTRLDVYLAGETARTLAETSGFDASAASEISLCAVELAMNMVIHAGGGVLTVDTLTRTQKPGILLTAEDDGGPSGVLPQDLVGDGLTTRRSLGCGLGSVQRLMDTLEIVSPRSPRGGTRVTAFRSRHVPAGPTTGCPLDVGIASRPCPGHAQNGDACVQSLGNEDLLIGVIDGLGHGQFAAKAAASAKNFVMKHTHLDLQALFSGASRMCRGTRGAAMTLGRLNWQERTIALAGMGNVDVRFSEGVPDRAFVPRRGIIGLENATVVPRVFPWDWDTTMLMHSDGIASACAEALGNSTGVTAQSLAADILARYARPNDDATVLVVKAKRRPDA